MNKQHVNSIHKIYSLSLVFMIFINFFSFFGIFYLQYESISVIYRVFFSLNYLILFILWTHVLLFERIKLDVIFLIIFMIISVLMTIVFFPNNYEYLIVVIPFIIYGMTGYCMIRQRIVDYVFFSNAIKVTIFIVTPIMIFILVKILDWNTTKHYMDFANIASWISAFSIYFYFTCKKKIYLVLGVLWLILIILFGSRGSSVTLLLYFTCAFLLSNRNIVTFFKRITIITVTVFFFIFIIESQLSEIKANSYIISLIRNNSFFESSGRIQIYNNITNIIADNYIFGVGLVGDRSFLSVNNAFGSVTYTHNIILEVLSHYGVILGGIMIICFLYLIINFILKINKISLKISLLILLFIFVSFLQLQFSRSYIMEPTFYFLIAFLYDFKKRNTLFR